MGPSRAPCVAVSLTPPSFLLLPFHVVFTFTAGFQPGADPHFVLAHILRRPIIVYGVKYYKSFRGETLGYTRFQGEHFVNSLVPVFHPSVEYCTVPRERGRTRLPL